MKPLIQLFIYIFFVMLCFFLSAIKYNNSKKTFLLDLDNVENNSSSMNSSAFGYINIFICAILFGIISIYFSASPLASDRYNYAIRYIQPLTFPNPWTPGLNYLANFLRRISLDPNVLIFSIAFICFYVTLFAFKKSKEATPYSLLLLLMSNFFIDSFYLFKQAPANAFSALFFICLINDKFILSLVFILISVLFHESALILLPIFFYTAYLKRKSKPLNLNTVLFLIIFFILFPYINIYIIELFVQIFPFLGNQISDYLDSSMGITDSANWLTVLKGFPFYLITLSAFINRGYLNNKIKKFNVYLLFSLLASLSVALSFYMYWLFRFGTYFYFPSILLAGLMRKHTKKNLLNLTLEISIFISLSFFTIRYLYQILFLFGGF